MILVGPPGRPCVGKRSFKSHSGPGRPARRRPSSAPRRSGSQLRAQTTCRYAGDMIVCVTLPRMARYGYARISTRSQRDDSQLDALRAAGCQRIPRCTASGRRPRWTTSLSREPRRKQGLHLNEDRRTDRHAAARAADHRGAGDGPDRGRRPPGLGRASRGNIAVAG